MIDIIVLVVTVVLLVTLWRRYRAFDAIITSTDCRNYGLILLCLFLISGSVLDLILGLLMVVLYFFNRKG